MNFRELVEERCSPPSEVPFPSGEYRERHRRIREAMAAAGIDLLYLTSPEALYYVSGYRTEWYQAQSPRSLTPVSGIALNIGRDGPIHFDMAGQRILTRMTSVIEDARFVPDDLGRVGLNWIVAQLRAEGWLCQSTRVGLEMWSYRPNRMVSHMMEDAFRDAGAEVIDGTTIVREARWRKSPAELACIERAAHFADTGIRAVASAITPGVTELELYGELIRAMTREGGEQPAIMPPVLSGPKTNCGLALSSERRVRAGEMVSVDTCGVRHRYHANISRAFWVGDPPDNVAAFYERAAAAREPLVGLLRPGLPLRELISSMREWYRNQGLWPHRLWLGGYEMGIAFPPDWLGERFYELEDDGTDLMLEPGSVVNYEGLFVLPDMAGMTWIIDMILVDETGARLLSELTWNLQSV